jgi:hypothetical protein
MKASELPVSMAQIVFGPSLLAYAWIMAKFVFAGLAIYILALVVGYKMGLFRDIETWPVASKAALFWSPANIIIALYWSTRSPSYWMVVPALAYMLLTIVGGLALRRRRDSLTR